jgi:hypothetical protein
MLGTSIYHQELNGLAISVIHFRSNKETVRVEFCQHVSTKPNVERSIDVPLVKLNCNDDCCDGSRCAIRLSITCSRIFPIVHETVIPL